MRDALRLARHLDARRLCARLRAAPRVAPQRRELERLRRSEAAPAYARGVLVRERLGVHGPQAWIADTVARRRHELPGSDHRVQRSSIVRVRLRLRIQLE